MTARHARATTIAAASLCIITTACTDSAASTVPTTTSTAPTAETVEPDDGTLTIAVLAPTVGDGAAIGRSVIAGAQLAVSDVNGAGGVNGAPVRLIVDEEELRTSDNAASVDEFVDAGVDAVVGPISSAVALSTLPRLVDQQLATCSPTATAMSLDNFPDDDLFFRTIPSDSLEAVAIAQEVENTGTDRAAIAYIDDAYGRAFAEAVRDALLRSGITAAVIEPFRTDAASPRRAAVRISADAADVVVVLAAAADGAVMLQALADSEGENVPTYIVNGAQETSAAKIATPTDFVARVRGVAPAATGVSADLDRRLRLASPDSAGYYALNAYDCVTLIALAAEAGNGQRSAIAAGVVGSSFGGSRCTTFAQCAAVIGTGRNADYDGPGGLLSLRANGDTAAAQFVIFGFDEDGRSIELSRFTASY